MTISAIWHALLFQFFYAAQRNFIFNLSLRMPYVYAVQLYTKVHKNRRFLGAFLLAREKPHTFNFHLKSLQNRTCHGGGEYYFYRSYSAEMGHSRPQITHLANLPPNHKKGQYIHIIGFSILLKRPMEGKYKKRLGKVGIQFKKFHFIWTGRDRSGQVMPRFSMTYLSKGSGWLPISY